MGEEAGVRADKDVTAKGGGRGGEEEIALVGGEKAKEGEGGEEGGAGRGRLGVGMAVELHHGGVHLKEEKEGGEEGGKEGGKEG